MGVDNRLTGEEEEWLVRAAIGSRAAIIPTHMVEALVAAGLGDKNPHGTLDINAAGRKYIAEQCLSTKEAKRRW